MGIFTIILIVVGLSLFEVASSVDNAIINAEVLSTLGKKAKRWFLTWGLLVSVFVVRGLLPWGIVWITMPRLGPIGAFTASFSSDPKVYRAVADASPILLIAGGTFLLFLFIRWLFLEEKSYGLWGERFFYERGVWFFAIVSAILSLLVFLSLHINPPMAFGAVIGSTCFFLVHGFQENAEKEERELIHKGDISDTSKLFYLTIIDATFSLDGVLGAFAFTLSIPLILIGSGLGAVVVRQLTVSNMTKVKKYIFLKNGAMYSIFFLSLIMILNSFAFHIPSFISPVMTLLIVGSFFYKSTQSKPD